ncbi:FAD binding domain-containing protein [Streptomyces sp. G-G2]|uniref:FAD binding domain-containing protein n=1 Tax=Streptomyces sp. G-G2 TaxID=3046201 RepID=UPI0024BBA5AD|nr:FAD binding domain-containing protein [Streptomyces sp. G-G2]MDJ0382889.1 FAD binding domain-containing protein [Streptomyces sp. G-G2]
MKPAPFDYVRPASAAEAVWALAAAHEAGRETRVLAGGQSLVPLLNQRLVRPDLIVDLGRVPSLNGIQSGPCGIRIGALTPHASVERSTDPVLHGRLPVLPEAAALIGQLPVRVRGTVGGSLAHADPGAEWCLLAVLLGAELTLLGPDGTRVVGADAFLRGRHRTALRPGEILVELRFPAAEPAAALVEYASSPGRTPEVAAAAALVLDADGRVAAARLALAGPLERPVRIPAAEALLIGTRPGPEAFAVAAAKAVRITGAAGDLGTLAAVLVRRALAESAARAAVLAPVRRPAPELVPV